MVHLIPWYTYLLGIPILPLRADKIIDSCENITFPQLLLRAVTIFGKITRNKQSLRLQSWPLYFPFLGICSSFLYTKLWLEVASTFLRTEPLEQDTMDNRSRFVWCFDDQLNEEERRTRHINNRESRPESIAAIHGT